MRTWSSATYRAGLWASRAVAPSHSIGPIDFCVGSWAHRDASRRCPVTVRARRVKSCRDGPRKFFPGGPCTAPGRVKPEAGRGMGAWDRSAGMGQCDQRRQRLIIALHHRSDRTLECPPERMHRTNRSTKFGNRHKQSILAPQQSVSAHEQFVFRLRMQQLAHLMRLRAHTIVRTPGRDRFFHISNLTSSAGRRPAVLRAQRGRAG